MTFHDLAEIILKESDKPLTANEIWSKAVEKGIDYTLDSKWKTSWANESYLVVAEISKNEDFRSELSRLSTSFGIGVIQLDIEDPNSSEVLFPAKLKENLDWETINKLTMNRDFTEFLKRVRIDLSSNEIRKEQYDKIYSDEELRKKFGARTSQSGQAG